MATVEPGRSVVADVRSYLEYLAENGQGSVAVSPVVMDALAARVEMPAVRGPVAPAATFMPEPASQATVATAPVAATPSGEPGEVPAGPDSTAQIVAEVAACTSCKLHATRTRVVPGQGNADRPDVMFIGEAPGYEEDQQGLAFVGKAGALLTKMIVAMGYSRDEVFIANICKCRPPENRTPTPMEMDACLPYLKRQIALVQPRVIVALGGTAVNGLVDLPAGAGISRVRGKWLSFEGIDLMPTFHPAYLLRTPEAKRPAWDDLKAVLAKLGRKPAAK